jgi:transposase
LSEAQVDDLREFTLAHADLSLGDLTRQFGEYAGLSLSKSTVRRYLNVAGVTRSTDSNRGTTTATAEAAALSPLSCTEQPRDEGDEQRYPHGLTDAEWELVSELFEQRGRGRPSLHSRRAVVDACFYVVRSGCPWRMLPRDMPPWQTVYSQFRRWSEAGVFERSYDRLRVMWRGREGRASAPTATIIDSPSR